MSFWPVLLWITLILAALPAGLTVVNISVLRTPRPRPGRTLVDRPAVSVLIPARNERRNIGAAVRRALASRDVKLEVLVYDDGSTDGTDDVVRAIAEEDAALHGDDPPRVRLAKTQPLPEDWNGKQHACQRLAEQAANPVLVWIDADVRLRPRALAAIVDQLDDSEAALISGFPWQFTGSWLERLIVPMIHLILVGYLPMPTMRESKSPGFAAGCGQLFITHRDDYEQMGGHAAIRQSMHDGVTLPKAYRKAGLMTDLFDATALARVRMYRSAGDVWNGFAKNAHEGMATAAALPVWTVLLLGGHVLAYVPALFWATGLADAVGMTRAMADFPVWLTGLLIGLPALLAIFTSILVGVHFRQPITAIIFRPVGVLLVLAIQVYSLVRRWAGRPVGWRGRDAVARAA